MRVLFKISGRIASEQRVLKNLLELICSFDFEKAVLPGGSVFADAVRKLQAEAGFSDSIAHWMAIKSMEVYGSMISRLNPVLTEAHSLSQVRDAWRRGFTPVVMPYKIMLELPKLQEVLPESWAVTSDSIAIAIAWLLGCDYAFISKVVDGLVVSGRVVGRVRIAMDYPIQSVIDNYALNLAGRLGVKILVFNAYKPWVLRDFLEGLKTTCTLVTV